ncbi:MAG: M23 family metallopeptidase [Bacteroidales bacterium]|jgi:murein DD-endopeptidase MepM/ murein hydrolase activator NlpD|nr:M23 family metallopeptidase [Bacteroidales bacterium]
MALKKYRFNPNTLKYEEIKSGFKQVLAKLTPYVISLVIFAAAFTYIYDKYFDTPEKQRLKTENEFLSTNLSQIKHRLDDFDAQMNKLAQQDNELYRVIYQMDSIPSKVRNSGYGGTNRYTKLKGHQSSGLVMDVAQRLDKLDKKLNIQKSSYYELSEVLKNSENRLNALPIIQPIHNKELTRIGSYYGMRLHPILRIYRMHDGIDLTAPTGTPVYAAGDGKVIRVDHNRSRRGYGNLVVIDHGYDGLETRYAHLNTIDVKKGQRVERGQQLGAVGNTGMSTAPHLHYEIRKNGGSINPLYYILDVTPDQYDELISISQIPGKSFD